jgi:transcriptional regulator with XRE-family HTH domain
MLKIEARCFLFVTKSTFSDEYEHLRRLLMEERKRANLTQVEVAQRLAQPQSFVSKYERGERRLDVIEFFEVTRALGVDPFDLLHVIYDSASAARKSDGNS